MTHREQLAASMASLTVADVLERVSRLTPHVLTSLDNPRVAQILAEELTQTACAIFLGTLRDLETRVPIAESDVVVGLGGKVCGAIYPKETIQ